MNGRKIILGTILSFLPLLSSAGPLTIDQVCNMKLGAIQFAFKYRESHGLTQTLDKFEKEYDNNYKTKLKFVTYLDIQRIINDVYRKDKDGNFRLPKTEEVILAYAAMEYDLCYKNGY